MQLKKINPNLQKALIEKNFLEPTEVQESCFGPIKSGIDLVIQSEVGSGKTTLIALSVIQKLEKAVLIAPRAVVIAETKEKVLALEELFKELAKYTDLRVYAVHDKSDLDYDKNMISVGVDILIGTPIRMNDMFATAGYDVNQLKIFVVDDADIIFRARLDAKIKRLADSIKTQQVLFCSQITERVESMAFQIMEEPAFYEME